MKLANTFCSLILTGLMAFLFAAAVSAQETTPSMDRNQGPPQEFNRPRDSRGDALRQLGLSRQQGQQIRRINLERKPLMYATQLRLRMANRSLDETIYADRVNEEEFGTRLKEVHDAQAEVARIRFMSELAHRRVLTPEQLTRFREIRRRFEQMRQNVEDRRPSVRELPPNDYRNLQRQPQPIRQLQKPNLKRPLR